jgi:NAD(P)-dependent dehydrogenase (short-subunit alcohol dehydrogenase family)
MADIHAGVPDADLRFIPLDLADLESVSAFATAAREQLERLDLLINNAGVMIPPEGKTKQGFELQFGVNHLGHFALTAQLFELLAATEGSRVVNLSSMAHRFGSMDFDDLDFQTRGYNASAAYGQSKLANLLFTRELARRVADAGLGVRVTAAHPGWTQTNLQRHSGVFSFLNPFLAMPTPRGALPTLRAAVDPDAAPGDYYGPKGFMEVRGWPTKVGTTAAAASDADAARLWQVSEERTGVTFDVARPTA